MYLPHHPDIGFENGDHDIVIEGHVINDQFDAMLKLGDVPHDQDRVQTIHQGQREARNQIQVE